MGILYVRCLVIQPRHTFDGALNIFWPHWQHNINDPKTVIQSSSITCASFLMEIMNKCQTLPVPKYTVPIFTVCWWPPRLPTMLQSHDVIIQLVTESAPKPSQCRLAQEKYRVGDSVSTRAFPASCSFNYASLYSAICYCSTMTWVTLKKPHWVCQ